RVLPGSRFVLDDDELVAPQIEGPGAIVVQSDVTGGWDEAMSELRPEASTMKVQGKVEFRGASLPGPEPVDGAPLAHLMPGEEVTLRVQMRTEVPLNEVFFELDWPIGALQWVGP